MHSGICCGLYRGTFYAKDLSDPNAALLPLGNAEATITQEMAEITQENFESLGGNACKVTYPSSVGIDFTLHCTSPENLAIAFLGNAYQKDADSIVNEEHVVHAVHELIAFEHVPNKQQPIVVTDGGATTYQVERDYIITNAGIKIPETTTIPMGSTIEVSYSHGANWVIDAQTTAQKTFEIVLDGVNVGEDGGERPVVLKAWRVKMSPTESFALIASEFASITVTGEILRDESKATGSKFMKVEFGDESSGSAS